MLQIFKALSDETRLRILSVLWSKEMCVCEIEASLGLTQSNVSRHLTILKNAGLINGDKRAQWMYYNMDQVFLREHAILCEYLQTQFGKLRTYEKDTARLSACKQMDLCSQTK